MANLDNIAIVWTIGIVAFFIGLTSLGDSVQNAGFEGIESISRPETVEKPSYEETKTKGNPFGDEVIKIREQSPEITNKISDLDVYFENIRSNPDLLVKFFEKMPKGADLHNHLSGNTQPELLIQIASENNLCVNLRTAKVVKAQLIETCPQDHEFVSKAYDNKTMYEFLLENWSIHNFKTVNQETGHDHFFDVFGKISEINKNVTAVLGYWKITAQEQNMQYMETMFNDPYINSDMIKIMSGAIKNKNIQGFQDAYNLIKKELNDNQVIENSVKNIELYDKDSTKFCIENSEESCDIPFRYIYQVLRKNQNDAQVFTQMIIGFETVKESELFVAINLVQEEDDKISMEKYNTHMEMLDFLKKKYPELHITLHAGELWDALPNITPNNMTSHIHDAIHTGNAERIGHGVDIKTEALRFPNLLKIMQEKPVPVEINLNSNYVILGIEPEDHPIQNYLENEIPVMISTDDPGILQSNMTHEYFTAAQNYGQLEYSDIKDIVRNSLEYSFLPGKSLWRDSAYKIRLPQCETETLESENCWIKEIDEKAMIQDKLEWQFEKFEIGLDWDP